MDNTTDILNATSHLIHAIKSNDEVSCAHILETQEVYLNKTDNEVPELETDCCYYIRSSTPIVIACDVGNPKIVSLLLAKGANINDTDNNSLTLLMKASIYNHVDVIKVLLSNGADIHEKNIYNGATAILYAALHSQKEAITLLMERGASIYDTTINGCNCYNSTFNESIKIIVKKWPIIMPIIMFQELLIYNQLDDSLLDLQEYMDEIIM
jgi:hypothetical protein